MLSNAVLERGRVARSVGAAYTRGRKISCTPSYVSPFAVPVALPSPTLSAVSCSQYVHRPHCFLLLNQGFACGIPP